MLAAAAVVGIALEVGAVSVARIRSVGWAGVGAASSHAETHIRIDARHSAPTTVQGVVVGVDADPIADRVAGVGERADTLARDAGRASHAGRSAGAAIVPIDREIEAGLIAAVGWKCRRGDGRTHPDDAGATRADFTRAARRVVASAAMERIRREIRAD
jgi:hypothetical protein